MMLLSHKDCRLPLSPTKRVCRPGRGKKLNFHDVNQMSSLVQFSPACPSDGLIPVPLLLSSLMMNQEDWNCTLKKSFAQWAKFTRSLFQFCNVYEELNIEQKVQNHHCYANILLILVWVNNSWVLLIWSNVKSIYLI